MSIWTPRPRDPNREWIKDKYVSIYLGDSKTEVLRIKRSWDNDKQTYSMTLIDAEYCCGMPRVEWGAGQNWLFHSKPYPLARRLIKQYVKDVIAEYRRMYASDTNISDPLAELKTQ